jgi:hypothetical protein
MEGEPSAQLLSARRDLAPVSVGFETASTSDVGVGVGIGVTERKIKVDPEVAYQSGLCKRCEPTRPPRWESGALLWLQVGFALLIAIIIILMLAAIVLSSNYVAKHCHNRPRNRRHHSSSSSSSHS